jgi:hypothetical protein
MPRGVSDLRDTVAIYPLLTSIMILGATTLGILQLPAPTPSGLLAQAAAPRQIDSDCKSSYDYSCKAPGTDSQGVECGDGLKVQTGYVQGHCVKAGQAVDDKVLTPNGQWVSPQQIGGSVDTAATLPNAGGTNAVGGSASEPAGAALSYPKGILSDVSPDLFAPTSYANVQYYPLQSPDQQGDQIYSAVQTTQSDNPLDTAVMFNPNSISTFGNEPFTGFDQSTGLDNASAINPGAVGGPTDAQSYSYDGNNYTSEPTFPENQYNDSALFSPQQVPLEAGSTGLSPFDSGAAPLNNFNVPFVPELDTVGSVPNWYDQQYAVGNGLTPATWDFQPNPYPSFANDFGADTFLLSTQASPYQNWVYDYSLSSPGISFSGSQFAGPVFNESTGQWEGGIDPYNNLTNGNHASPLTPLQPDIPNADRLQYSDWFNVAPNSVRPSPSDQISQFELNNNYPPYQLPSEYQPSPGEIFHAPGGFSVSSALSGMGNFFRDLLARL